jgi:hypothetical protein
MGASTIKTLAPNLFYFYKTKRCQNNKINVWSRVLARLHANCNEIKISMCGADCWPDHMLIVMKLNIHVQPKKRPQGTQSSKVSK